MMGTLTIVEKGDVFELVDIEPEEVSVVDRAANKRKFICVKREGDMPKTQVVEKDGKLVMQETEETTESGSETGDAAVGKLDLSLSSEQKTNLGGKLQEAMERVLEVTNAVRTAKEDAESTTSDALTAEVQTIKSLIDEVEKMLVPAEETPDGATAQPDATQPEGIGKSEVEIRKVAQVHAALLKEKMDLIKSLATDIAENADSMDLKDLHAKMSSLRSMGWQVEDLADTVNLSKSDTSKEAPKLPAGLTLDDLQNISKGDQTAIAKLGRKMSSNNLGRYKKSISELETVIKTFVELYEALLPAESEKRATAKRMLENIGITQASDYYKDSVGSGKQPDPTAMGNMGDNAGAEGKVTAEMKDLQKKVKDQEAEIKKQGKVIKQLGSTVDAPSSGKPEGGAVHKAGKADGGEEKQVYWGLDLNDPNYLEAEGLK